MVPGKTVNRNTRMLVCELEEIFFFPHLMRCLSNYCTKMLNAWSIIPSFTKA